MQKIKIKFFNLIKKLLAISKYKNLLHIIHSSIKRICFYKLFLHSCGHLPIINSSMFIIFRKFTQLQYIIMKLKCKKKFTQIFWQENYTCKLCWWRGKKIEISIKRHFRSQPKSFKVINLSYFKIIKLFF